MTVRILCPLRFRDLKRPAGPGDPDLLREGVMRKKAPLPAGAPARRAGRDTENPETESCSASGQFALPRFFSGGYWARR